MVGKENRSRELKIKLTETDYENLTEILGAYEISSPDEFFHQSVSYWFRPKVKGAIVSQFTILGQIEEWVTNFGRNMHMIIPREPISNDVWDLRPEPKLEPKAVGQAIIIGAGPSIFQNDFTDLRLLAQYQETLPKETLIFACDRILKSTLECGVIPDFVTAVDASVTVAEWLSDPVIQEYKAEIPLLANASVHYRVAQEWLDAGGKVFWFIGSLDEQVIQNVAHTLHLTSKKTVIHTGGNVGATSWFLAALLKRNPVILIGFDYGYPIDVPIWDSQKFDHFVSAHKGKVTRDEKGELISVELPTKTCLDNIFKQYRRIYNPYWKKWCVIDYLFECMRSSFIGTLRNMLASGAFIRTVNCTPGGTLFDEETRLIQIQPWEEFLKFGPPPKPDWVPTVKDLPEEFQQRLPRDVSVTELRELLAKRKAAEGMKE